MKSLKAAAVLAGSLIAATVAAPAYAADDSRDLASTGLDTGLRTGIPFEMMPLSQETNVLNGERDASVLGTAKEAAAVVNEAKPVHGDLGLHA
ncbi:hypothetical protein N4P33_29295 [Streptomyces sp. 15-116A]|uniref:hypothetical protein n=1 Tax=Streptomyces sp. 15-116A TaxID=2259035 RepID=UPI0021B2418D|nr:hypothetical protein [Streptomyces sp. 15-116A]MCT7356212.1 hypothetical protein [Streptomyces sp. 15-116A]